ncbi:MAG: hypothetical protein GX409_01015 [candidate division Zixibacteria bacterium]|jgi:hypothetical protein|nr:hypothetical protein [candidate division Zixibacteria bacterium]
MTETVQSKRCAYLKFCYLAEAANCFGYKIDCPLYMVSNNEEVSEYSFHKAMDTLIDKTKVKMENTPSSKKDI